MSIILPREIAVKLIKAAESKSGEKTVHVHCEHHNLDGSVSQSGEQAARIGEALMRLRKPQDITLNTLGERSVKGKDSQELEK